MDTDLRNRVVLPILLPLGILLGLAAVVGSVAFILLYSTKGIAILAAGLMATGIMVAMSLASSTEPDDLDTAKRGVIVLSGVVPVLASAGLAIYLGATAPESIQFNVEPIASFPEGAVTAAQNSETFCILGEDGESCEDTQEYTLPAQPHGESFSFQFVNLQANVPHNLQIFELAEEGGEPAPGELVFGVAEGSATINGVADIVYQVDQSAGAFEPGQEFYYNCVVHPVMDGVLTVGEPVG